MTFIFFLIVRASETFYYIQRSSGDYMFRDLEFSPYTLMTDMYTMYYQDLSPPEQVERLNMLYAEVPDIINTSRQYGQLFEDAAHRIEDMLIW